MKNQTLKNLEKLRFNWKIWLETNDNQAMLGDGKWQLLKAIDEKGSLKEAMDDRGYTYRKTWDKLKKIEEDLGFPIIETTRGGSEKGKTVLTTEGRFIVRAFERFHRSYDELFDRTCREVLEELKRELK